MRAVLGVVDHRDAAAGEHLVRDERDVGGRQHQAGDAAVVELVELLGVQEAVVGRAEGQLAGRLAVEVDVHLGMAGGEQVERGDGQLVRAARRRGAAVVADARAPALGPGRAIERVGLEVAAEVEVVGLHAVVAAQHLREPPAVGDAVEAEAIGRLGQQRLAAGRVEGRLEVRDAVAARAQGRGGEHRVRGLPAGGEDDVGVLDARAHVAHLGADVGQPGAHVAAVLLDVPAVAVVEVDDAGVAGLLERADEAEHRGVAAGGRARRDGDPGDGERLARRVRRGRGEDPAAGGDLGRAHEVLARDGQPGVAGRRERGGGALAQARGDAGGALAAQQAARLAQAIGDAGTVRHGR